MSLPPLRQPKHIEKQNIENRNGNSLETQYVIVTLNDGHKLVVSSDAYHGILTAGELYKCIFCESEMVLDILCKERHKQSQNHKKILEAYPHMEDYKDNLIRQVNINSYYCTICNVVVLAQFLTRHLTAEAHVVELEKALSRVEVYKPNC